MITEIEIEEILIDYDILIDEIQVDIIKIFPELENLEIKPSGQQQVFTHPNSYGYDNVIVSAVASDILNVVPKTEKQQHIGLYGTVNVEGVNNSIDSNIKAENIKNGINILGVEGNVIELKGEEKTINPQIEKQIILPSEDKNAITKVIIEAVDSSIDTDIKPENIKKGVSILGIEGSIIELKGEEKTITPTLEEQVILPSEGKNAITKITVEKVDSSIDTDIKPENIKKGVSILGIEGNVDDSFYDDFWDNFQDYGKRDNYSDAFRRVNWTPQAFKPKYNFKPTNAYYMFATGGDYKGTFDLSKHLEDLGIVLDFSNCTQMQGVFSDSRFTGLPIIDTRSATNIGHLFAYCFYVKKIDKLILKNDGSQTIDNIFQSVKYLEDIEIEGLFGKSFSMQWAEYLTINSAINIINHLKDLTGSTAQTLTLHANVKAKLTDEQIASITSKNWNLA